MNSMIAKDHLIHDVDIIVIKKNQK